MIKEQKKIMQELVQLLENSDYQLDNKLQREFNVYSTMVMKQILELDYMVPFQIFQEGDVNEFK